MVWTVLCNPQTHLRYWSRQTSAFLTRSLQCWIKCFNALGARAPLSSFISQKAAAMMEHKNTQWTQKHTGVNLKTKLNICFKSQLSVDGSTKLWNITACLTSTTPAVRNFWQWCRYYLAGSCEQLTRMKSDRYKKQKMPPYGMNIMLMFQVSSSSRSCLIWVHRIYMYFNDYTILYTTVILPFNGNRHCTKFVHLAAQAMMFSLWL